MGNVLKFAELSKGVCFLKWIKMGTLQVKQQPNWNVHKSWVRGNVNGCFSMLKLRNLKYEQSNQFISLPISLSLAKVGINNGMLTDEAMPVCLTCSAKEGSGTFSICYYGRDVYSTIWDSPNAKLIRKFKADQTEMWYYCNKHGSTLEVKYRVVILLGPNHEHFFLVLL